MADHADGDELRLAHPLEPAARPEPDLMNDPAFDPVRRRKEKVNEEGDTCRICRAEGSTDEPLFYPCKCSGSIKFVHQECLLEWLSHSQKKHCELCKTPFRFTKLYHPQMPSTVPFHVFAKQGTLHIFRSLLTWARWNLVILVWLGWVPWCMRTVWRSLFYLGDGGWISAAEIERRLAAVTAVPSTTWAIPDSIGMQDITSAGHMPATVGGSLWNTWKTNFEGGAGTPVVLRVWQRIFRIALYPLPELASAARNSTTSASVLADSRPPSLLSAYPFFTTLTRSTTINDLAIDVLEGQLITLLIVVGFILVFLIREWVVQQQPVVIAGQVPELPVDGPAADDEAEIEAIQAPQPADEHAPAEQIEPDNAIAADREIDVDEIIESWEQVSPEAAQSHDPAASALEHGASVDQAVQTDHLVGYTRADVNSELNDVFRPSSAARPSLPHRGALGPASEIRRTLEEEALVSGQAWPGVDVFMDLWRRAESDPEEVLRIIRADGREKELSWIVAAMARLQNGMPPQDALQPNLLPSLVTESDVLGGSQSAQSPFGNNVLQTSQRTHGSQDASHGADVHPPDREQNNVLPTDLAALHRARIERSRASEPTQTGTTTSVSTQTGRTGRNATEDTRDLDRPDLLRDHSVHSSAEVDLDHAYAYGESLSEHAEEPQVAPNDFTAHLRNWFWGDIPLVEQEAEDQGDDDEHVIEDMAAEAPFVPFANGQLAIEDREIQEQDAEHQDPEVLQAAADAGINPNDPEGIEDGEDLEGILELIGAQGPLIGLIQNGLFSALLIAISFIAGIWVPYLVGKVVLVFAANPVSLLLKMPLRGISALADSIVDSLVFLAGAAFCAVDACIRITAIPIGWVLPLVKNANQDRLISKTAYNQTLKSANRLAQTLIDSADMFSESDVPLFSIVAHESLISAKSNLYRVLVAIGSSIRDFAILSTSKSFNLKRALAVMQLLSSQSLDLVNNAMKSTLHTLGKLDFRSFSLHINFDTPQRTSPIDYSLAYWSTQDRVIAILLGYLFFCTAGSAYLKLHSRGNGDQADRAQSAFVDILHQAGGVTKVILIISIEMIVFPLYCGALLDIALLPLFQDADLSSRLMFTSEAPLTSTFIHWFIGTCYMFHFALFVSMCRRILRTGVLYFIRDPDDPSFHPVRDVLERSVSTQLRKIAFSALVYGGLVIVCLGAIVWGMDRVTTGIFPIRWTSSAPVLDSPVDLLVYNFVMPFAITFTEPATILHAMYQWWFRKCARWLRLTHFLFGERVEDEMYVFVRDPFKDFRVKDRVAEHEQLNQELRLTRSREVATYYLNGYFVRAPGSDQVRLPKGTKTFVPIDELGRRLDGLPDNDQGLHGRNNRLFKKIFIPRRFGVRITTFLILLWLFAGVTGVGSTMIPLWFGRWLFRQLCPSDFQVNDIYAFAVGAYLLGVPLYLTIRFFPTLNRLASQIAATPLSAYMSIGMLQPMLIRSIAGVARVLRLVYFYGMLGLLLPALTGLLWELYVVIPLLTLSHTSSTPPYTIRFVQAWTLAVVALKFCAKVLLERPDNAPARALRALVNPLNRGAGWADPDVRLATRAIIVPALAILALALALPPMLAAGIQHLAVAEAEASRPLVYRYAYPAVLAVGLSIVAARGLGHGLKAWRERVRDEVFLVGERLHNFGERTAGGSHIGRPALDRRGSQRVELE